MSQLSLSTSAALTQSASPRLQQAVRLLQMSSQDFARAVREALESNPLLEADEGETMPEGQGSSLGDWSLSSAGSRIPSADSDGEAAWERSAAPISLRAHLHGQLDLLRLPERDILLARAVIESLDDEGYLRGGIGEIEQAVHTMPLAPKPDEQEIRMAWRRVQGLDPAGVAAVDLRHCLLLQLNTMECATSRALVRRAIENHLKAVALRDPARLSEALGVSRDMAASVCALIRTLNPSPCRAFLQDDVPGAVPDVVAVRSGRGWQMVLNDAVMPRLRVHAAYVRIFQQRKRNAESAALSACLQEARWLVGNVSQRFATILAVARAIGRHQQAFFEYGPLALKPLKLQQIAQEVGVHESTVSRVTNNKFMATPFGLHELKYFFSRGLSTSNGSSCAPAAVKQLVSELIAAESPSHALSDAAIAGLLAQQGFSVARRTVTKYRQALRISAAPERHQNL
ncbi:RNA polymerase factor sigma-54 [Acidovorax sp. NCPPB 3576]|uniref:RNA polymerase factor sigma-54 n=1 Tax=Acidovorax sp. NCPPB 3576 TaxID=2940488 RepID=UPI00234B8DC8|nr:RNA polymerase factor sigma-54 [Acidovorax sp. NCPPB 3576]WCM86351.1 RNA polymerase factor sigma-54 [Acidovorax sp. NCPPB 3576]